MAGQIFAKIRSHWNGRTLKFTIKDRKRGRKRSLSELDEEKLGKVS